nr:hypothetical protein [Sphingopyxis sp. A083]
MQFFVAEQADAEAGDIVPGAKLLMRLELQIIGLVDDQKRPAPLDHIDDLRRHLPRPARARLSAQGADDLAHHRRDALRRRLHRHHVGVGDAGDILLGFLRLSGAGAGRGIGDFAAMRGRHQAAQTPTGGGFDVGRGVGQSGALPIGGALGLAVEHLAIAEDLAGDILALAGIGVVHPVRERARRDAAFGFDRLPGHTRRGAALGQPRLDLGFIDGKIVGIVHFSLLWTGG